MKNTTNRKYKISLVIIALYFIVNAFAIPSLHAEGTKEIMPVDSITSRLCVYPNFSKFAFYNCPADYRLHIHIRQVGEIINVGFGDIYDANSLIVTDMVFRIRDASGVIVVPETTIPSSGSGYISTHAKALLGPNTIVAGGYTPLTYTPNSTGDFYIELNYPQPTVTDNKREISLIDITVSDANQNAINGRLWSKEWLITTTPSPGTNPYRNPFIGKLFIYSNDGIVTATNFNGMRPLVFAITANSTGTANTGNTLLDRKSVNGKFTYPEFKIFLNDPDSLVYPTGSLGAFTSPMTFSGCPGKHCINVTTDKKASVQLLIDLNGVIGYQVGSEDVLIVQNVNAGTSCIPWDGYNSFGQKVAPGTAIRFMATFGAGLTNMPLYDVEYNPYGYKVNLIRPVSSTTTFNLYWDDSNLPNFTTPPSNGCNGNNGCHTFPFMFGDQRTINTWWYAVTDIRDSLHIVYNGLHIDSTVVNHPLCSYDSTGSIDIFSSGGTSPTQYTVSGSLIQSSPHFGSLSPHLYSIIVNDSNNCKLYDTVEIVSQPAVSTLLSLQNDTCKMGTGSIHTIIQMGNGPFTYQWSTSVTDTLSSLQNVHKGVYTVTIYDKNNCHFSFTDSISNNPSLLAIQATVFHDTCSNGQGKIALNLTNGAQPYQYIWSTVPTQNQAIAQNLSSGTYRVTITENGFCTHTDSFQIQNMPPPLPDFSFAKDACLENLMLLTYNGNNIPPDNYNWDFANATHVSGQGKGPHELKFQNIGPYIIKLNVNKLGCPSDSVQHTVNIHDLIIQNDSMRNVSCPGENNGFVAFSVIDGLPPYQISCATTGINSLNNLILKSGNHQVYISDSIGCIDSIQVNITEPLPIDAKLNINNTSCTYACDGSIGIESFGGTKPYQLKWDFPIQSTDTLVKDLCVGNYSVVVTDSNQCKDTIQIKLDNSVDINADFKSSIPLGSQSFQNYDFTFTGFGATNYDWNFGGISNSSLRNPSFLFPEAKFYEVKLIVNSGAPYYCVDSTKRLIEAIPPYDIYIPNAFTPNGNGLNDKYMIYANGVKHYNIKIFNRWGELVYESSDIMVGWNGKVNGEEAPLSVYVYLIEVLTIRDKQDLKIGSFTLIR